MAKKKLSKKKVLEGLNDKQKEAVQATENHVFVIAGAGSGKTRVLSRRYAYLTDVMDIDPKSILCATFTRKAAGEMRNRINGLVGDRDCGYISTFHALCVGILKEHYMKIGLPKNFPIIDPAYMFDIFESVYDEYKITKSDISYHEAKEEISLRKTRYDPTYYTEYLGQPISLLKDKYESASNIHERIYYGYMYHCKKVHGIDYNDIIAFTLYLFETYPEVLEKWQKQFEYIMVDEYQDVNYSQINLTYLLSQEHHNVFVVGDPDQMIYSWRGAKEEHLLNFGDLFNSPQLITMDLNYRSTKEILDVANSLIEKNVDRFPKELKPTRVVPDALPVTVNYSPHRMAEAEWIAKNIEKLHKKGRNYSEIAILYRAHYLSKDLEKALNKSKIPYTLYGAHKFYEREEIKGALSYFRMLLQQDDVSLTHTINVPKRGFGKPKMAKLEEYAKKSGKSKYDSLKDNIGDPSFDNDKIKAYIETIDSLSKEVDTKTLTDIVSEVLDKSGYMDHVSGGGNAEAFDNLSALLQDMADFERAAGEPVYLRDYLEYMGIMDDVTEEDTESKVQLMTVNASKGQEFPVVFVFEMIEGTFPSSKVTGPEGMEEERRLAFVAMTRAEDELYLTLSGGASTTSSSNVPSRFIYEIDQKLLKYEKKPPKDKAKKAEEIVSADEKVRTRMTKGLKFKVGDRVRHPSSGEGTVTFIDIYANKYKIKFDMYPTERTLGAGADLEKI